MIQSMPRPRPPRLHREETRHGNVVWYVRVGKGPRIRIRAAFGTAEFEAEYQAAINGAARPAKGAPAAGTLAWLIARYRERLLGHRSPRPPDASARISSSRSSRRQACSRRVERDISVGRGSQARQIGTRLRRQKSSTQKGHEARSSPISQALSPGRCCWPLSLIRCGGPSATWG